MKYRKELDGLRAVALIPIMFLHAGFNTFSGGFVGVDVFFVLSGYLITSIMLGDLRRGTFSIGRFYERRARRILPALFVVLLICSALVWFWLLPAEIEQYSKSLLATLFFVSNVFFWKTTGYFDVSTELNLLIHTWSLAIEEQFYMLFPLLLWVLWKWGQRWIIPILSIIALMSLALAQYSSTRYASFDFYLLPTRTWELLSGALLALYIFYRSNQVTVASSEQTKSTWIQELASATGLGLIAYAQLTFHAKMPFPGVYALVPIIGATLIILFGHHYTWVGKLLSTKIIAGIGLISYSAYLWHQPLFAFARLRSLQEPSHGVFVLLILATFVLAMLTWALVEQPFRHRPGSTPQWLSNRKTVVIGVVTFGLLLASALLGIALPKGNEEANARYQALSQRIAGNQGLGPCGMDFDTNPQCRTSAAQNSNPEILVWGDSFAMHLVDGIIASNPDVKLIQATLTSCAPIIGLTRISGDMDPQQCFAFNDKVMRYIREHRNIRYVVISSPFHEMNEAPSVLQNGKAVDTDRSAIAAKHLKETLSAIEKAGATPILISPPPQSEGNHGLCLVNASLKKIDLEQCDFPLVKLGYPESVHQGLQQSGAKVISLVDFMCDQAKCKSSKDGVFLYRDPWHLSIEGSQYVGKQMDFYRLITSD
jgi:peptidoglycan/LPS O-acetylase OafA/YrhL